MIEDGDVVEISYVGRVKDSGEIFDLTSREVAEEEGYDTDEVELGPIKVLVGARHVIPGLDDALAEMDAGEERTVEVAAARAFGERDSDAIETFPKREFDEYDVEPRRGLVVEIDGRRGKIVSATSGRVRVDFNHPLAGKDLEYDVEVREVLEDVAARVEAVLDYYGMDDIEVDVDGGDVTVEVPDEMRTGEIEDRLREELERVKGVESVEIG